MSREKGSLAPELLCQIVVLRVEGGEQPGGGQANTDVAARVMTRLSSSQRHFTCRSRVKRLLRSFLPPRGCQEPPF